jgi:hypothetical protein
VSNDAVIAEIVKVVGDMTEDQVRRVLAARDMVHSGSPVGTVMRDPKTGAVATRVTENGVAVWQVCAPAGDKWVDMQPTLNGWTQLHDGNAE